MLVSEYLTKLEDLKWKHGDFEVVDVNDNPMTDPEFSPGDGQTTKSAFVLCEEA